MPSAVSYFIFYPALPYPELSAFCQDVVNGEKNTLTVTVENKSDRKVTLLNVAGALLHPDSDAVLKNVRRSVNKPSTHINFLLVDDPKIRCTSS